MSTSTSEAAYFSVLELAQYLGISRHTAYMLVREGAVPSVRVGGQYRIPRVELARRLSEQTTRLPSGEHAIRPAQLLRDLETVGSGPGGDQSKKRDSLSLPLGGGPD